jgi:hypothetical protein
MRPVLIEPPATTNPDPGKRLMQDMLGLVDRLAEENAAHRVEIAPLVARVETLIAAAERASNKPLLNSWQIQHDLLPLVVHAIRASWVVTSLVMLGLGCCVGAGIVWWETPALECGTVSMTMADKSTRPICFRFNGPARPAPTVPVEPEAKPVPQKESLPTVPAKPVHAVRKQV